MWFRLCRIAWAVAVRVSRCHPTPCGSVEKSFRTVHWRNHRHCRDLPRSDGGFLGVVALARLRTMFGGGKWSEKFYTP